MYLLCVKRDITLYVLLDMSKISPCSVKEGDLQLMRYSFSVYIHMTALWPDDDQSSGWKLVVT